MSRSDPVRTKLLASSGTLAVIAFFILGFIFNAWAWAWVVFLVPGVVAIWFGDEPERKAVGRRRDTTSRLPQGHEGSEQGSGPPPPQRYEG